MPTINITNETSDYLCVVQSTSTGYRVQSTGCRYRVPGDCSCFSSSDMIEYNHLSVLGRWYVGTRCVVPTTARLCVRCVCVCERCVCV